MAFPGSMFWQEEDGSLWLNPQVLFFATDSLQVSRQTVQKILRALTADYDLELPLFLPPLGAKQPTNEGFEIPLNGLREELRGLKVVLDDTI